MRQVNFRVIRFDFELQRPGRGGDDTPPFCGFKIYDEIYGGELQHIFLQKEHLRVLGKAMLEAADELSRMESES